MPKALDLNAAMAAAQAKKDQEVDDLQDTLHTLAGEAGILVVDLGSTMNDTTLSRKVRLEKGRAAKVKLDAMIRAARQNSNPRSARESDDMQSQDKPPAQGNNQGRRSRPVKTREQKPQKAPDSASKPASTSSDKPKKGKQTPASQPADPSKGPNPLVKGLGWLIKKG